MTLSQKTAETIGLQALTWLAGHDDLLPVFMGATGVGEDDIRNSVQDPDFMGSILDFIMQDDAWVVEFCDHVNLAYDMPLQARNALPGGGLPHWT